jgi:hypothetical protein
MHIFFYFWEVGGYYGRDEQISRRIKRHDMPFHPTPLLYE